MSAPVIVRAPVMGTGVTFQVHGAAPAAARAAIADALAWLRWVDLTFSTYRPDSQISRLDAGTLAAEECCEEVREVLGLCLSALEASGGYFDAHADGRLDPSGMVKGWAVESASALLADAGLSNHLVECGGDIRMRGRPVPAAAWKVGIAHPLRAGGLCAVLELTDGAVATSGTYQRGLHVIDPHTGRAPRDVVSVTIIGASLTDVDARATAALAMGSGAVDWLAGQTDVEAMVIDTAARSWRSPGFHGYELDLPTPPSASLRSS